MGHYIGHIPLLYKKVIKTRYNKSKSRVFDILCPKQGKALCNSYTMGCLPVRGDNPRALASGLSYVQVDKHGITISYHLHLCRPCTDLNVDLNNLRCMINII